MTSAEARNQERTVEEFTRALFSVLDDAQGAGIPWERQHEVLTMAQSWVKRRNGVDHSRSMESQAAAEDGRAG